jgi:tRNA threonylcarbamoyl adenosine modification protein (Sua5/YciO/YrdC/YwlC family)
MAKLYEVHPENPQQRSLDEIVQKLRNGAVMLYPTDTAYAIGCDLESKSAIDRVRQIKKLANDKPLTFLCPSLSNIATYAIVHDNAYRLMKHWIPGPYTFILPATKLVPKLIRDPKRKTTGIRVPNHKVCQELLSRLGNPLISTSAHTAEDEESGEEFSQIDKARLFDYFDNLVDLAIDDGSEATDQISTVLDMSGETPIAIRQGSGWFEIAKWID